MGEEEPTEVKPGVDFAIEIRHADMEQSMQVRPLHRGGQRGARERERDGESGLFCSSLSSPLLCPLFSRSRCLSVSVYLGLSLSLRRTRRCAS